MTPKTTPTKLNLKRDEKLDITWQDGTSCTYTLSYLRSMCPCATCKEHRNEQSQRKSLLTILPGNYAGKLIAEKAELVGNYALRIEWSDQHASGIYSFQYLREICPGKDDKVTR